MIMNDQRLIAHKKFVSMWIKLCFKFLFATPICQEQQLSKLSIMGHNIQLPFDKPWIYIHTVIWLVLAEAEWPWLQFEA